MIRRISGWRDKKDIDVDDEYNFAVVAGWRFELLVGIVHKF